MGRQTLIKALKKFRKKIADHHQIDRVVLFGSQAEGTAKSESDVDLFIEVKRKSKKIEKEIKNIEQAKKDVEALKRQYEEARAKIDEEARAKIQQAVNDCLN